MINCEFYLDLYVNNPSGTLSVFKNVGNCFKILKCNMKKDLRNSDFFFLHCLESSVFSLRHFLKMFVTFFSCLLKLFKEPCGYTWSKQTVLQGLSQAIHHPQNQPNLWQNHPRSCVVFNVVSNKSFHIRYQVFVRTFFRVYLQNLTFHLSPTHFLTAFSLCWLNPAV